MISLTPDQLSNTRAFFATNPSAENIYSTAQNLGLSANQLADVYSQATGASASDALSNINAYLGQTGQTLTGGFVPEPIQVTPQQPQTVVTQQPTTNVYEEAANALRSAAGRTEELMGYTPERIQAVLAQTPKTIPEVDMAAYMNPYTQEVINRTQADILRQQQMAENALGAQAAAAGAFGGSRFGVAQGVLGGEYGRLAADTAANLRQQGYTQATNLAQQDISNQIRADLANQAAQNAAAYQNVTSGLQGAQLGLSGAQQLANIGNLGFGMANTIQQDMMMQGALQQQQTQALIDLAKAQYAGYTGFPATSLSYMSSALGATPVPQTSTTSKQPGLFDYLTLAAVAAPKIPSDIRLKTDIKQIGELPNGLKTYSWKWNKKAKDLGVDHFPTIGVIAQEAKKVVPHAVMEGADGYLRVNYREII